jgi:hypothetical protein
MRGIARVLTPVLVILIAGCGTVHIDAPEGKRVRLLPEDAPTSVHVEETVWYFGWGAVDLSDTHTAGLLETHQLSEARFQVTYNFWDSLLNTFTSVLSFSRRRIIIDGNKGGS